MKVFLFILLLLPLSASFAQTTPQAPVLAPGQNGAEAFTETTAVDSLLTEDLIRNLRDPFAPPADLAKKETPKSELETFQLRDIRLNGVITGPKKVRAMITGPGNKTFFVAVGDRVGVRQGRITAIQSEAIKVVEYETDDRGVRTPEIFEIRINGEIVSLSKKEE